ncbi:DUF1772 domain-containing protein [Amycolatopsis sp.]|jgi:uncharacterized membrane protein|uniref:anthrone oxygenase family protein n=1 Tax=Amycolatopsis sp. TaxID=37632 RepID=UPI002DF9720C|nr:anthrone oxygenase family protein [Amycolatopsis sp.]
MLALSRTVTLIASVLTMGLSAGLFYAFSCSVMLGLNQADDRTFVVAMQRINVAILNPWFMLSFLGAMAFTILAGILRIPGGGGGGVLPWIIAAAILYAVVLGVTGGINVPLNNQLLAAGEPSASTDFAAVRAAFETTWNRWNLVRALSSTAAFGCLTWALVLHGRAS